MLSHLGDHLRRLILVIGIVGRDQPAGDHVEQHRLVPRQRRGVRRLFRGHDGVVVADLGIVVKALGLQAPVQLRRVHEILIGRGQPLERRGDPGLHVVRQVPAVRAGIGDQLVGLIQRLGRLERLVRGKAQLPIGLLLQAGQIVQLGRRHLLAVPPALPHGPLPARHRLADSPGLRLVHAAGVPGLGVLPKALVIAKIGSNLPVVRGYEALDLHVSLYDQIQRGRLHPSHGQVGVVGQRKGPGGVHAHQPVRLAAAARALIQRIIEGGGLQLGKALLDGRVRHGGYPQPLHRLLAARHLIDVPKDQLALPGGVRGADQAVELLVQHQLLHHGKLALGARQHLQGDALGQHGQIVHAPLHPARVRLPRLAQRNQVADGPRHHIFLAQQAALSPALHAQHPGDIPAHGGLLGHDQLLGHMSLPSLSRLCDCFIVSAAL